MCVMYCITLKPTCSLKTFLNCVWLRQAIEAKGSIDNLWGLKGSGSCRIQKAFPKKTKSDALYFDTSIRLPMLKIMSHKADQNGAPVYGCVFTQSRLMLMDL